MADRLRRAAVISDVAGPLPALAALCGAGSLHSSTVAAGVGWGLMAMFFAAILPYLVTWRVRHPSHGGRPDHRTRAAYMSFAGITSVIGVALLVCAGAPAAVVDVLVAIAVSLIAVAIGNRWWRWSNHMAACAAGVAMLMVLFGVPAVLSCAALPAVAWARLALGRHTPAELIGGAACGALTAGPVLALLLRQG